MWSITRKLMKRDSRMMVPAGIAIAISAFFIAATFLFGNMMDASVRKFVMMDAGAANYAILSESEDDRNVASLKLDEFHVDKLTGIKGVKGVRVNFSVPLVLNTRERTETHMASVVGDDPDLMPVKLASGQWPADEDQIVLSKPDAKKLGVKIGDQVKVNVDSQELELAMAQDDSQEAPGGGTGDESSDGSQEPVKADPAVLEAQRKPVMMRLVGISTADYGQFAYTGGSAVVTWKGANSLYEHFKLGDMKELEVTGPVYVSLDDKAAQDRAVTDQVKALAPAGYTLMDRKAMEDQALHQQLGNDADIPTIFLLTFGILAMFISALVIANTFQVMVARQRKTLALLRTIGARKGQIRASVITQSGILGLIASLVGTALAVGVVGVLSLFHLKLSDVEVLLDITPRAVLLPVVFGTLVTILASLGSARTATRVSPVEALRPVDTVTEKRTGRTRLVFSFLLILLGGLLAAYAVWQCILFQQDPGGKDNPSMMAQNGESSSSIVLGLAVLGAMLIFLGVLTSARSWIPRLLGGLGRLVSLSGPSAKIATANISRNKSRVAATGTALLIGVTLVSCMAVGATSAKDTLGNTINQHYALDVEISGPDIDVTEATMRKVSKVKGVKAVEKASVNYGAMIKDGKARKDSRGEICVYSIDPQAASRVLNVDLSKQLGAAGRIILPAGLLAERGDIKDGARIDIRFERGGHAGDGDAPGKADRGESKSVDRSFIGTAAGYSGLSGLADDLYALAPASGMEGVAADNRELWVRSDGSVGPADLVADIRQVLGEKKQLAYHGGLVMKATYDQEINIMLLVMMALLAVAVIIALIGVANTLSLSVIERTRESATLRAIGMTKTQIRRSLAVEAALIALGSSLAGLVLGTLAGWLGSYVVFCVIGKVSLSVPWSIYVPILLVALVAAVLASILPARRATRTSPVAALAEE